MCLFFEMLKLAAVWCYVGIAVDTFSDRGEKVAHALVTVFAVGVKGVTDKRTSPHNIPAVEPPNRPPDSTVEQRTSLDQVRTGMHMLHATFHKPSWFKQWFFQLLFKRCSAWVSSRTLTGLIEVCHGFPQSLQAAGWDSTWPLPSASFPSHCHLTILCYVIWASDSLIK
jgi:hypothetical protein